MNSRKWPPSIVVALMIACLVTSVSGHAAELTWRTTEELRRELQTPLGITWSTQSLRDALFNLSTNVHVAIWLDRRIDPTHKPDMSFENTPLRTILQQVAAPLQADLGFVGPVVYIGPPVVASRLWTLTELRQEEARALPAAVRSKWTNRRPVQWPPLSTPRELLAGLAQEAGCQIEGLDAIPHDLWPACDLPPMTIPEQFQLILAGFDRTFELARDGGRIRLIPLPDHPGLLREYTPRGDPTRILGEITRRFPNANIQRSGTKLAVRGTAEEQDAIGRLLRGEPVVNEPVRQPPATPAQSRYTMTAQNNPLGVILRTLEVKSKLHVSVDAGARDKLQKLVSFEVKDATLQQLLEAAMQGTGLMFQLDGLNLRIAQADK